MSFYGQRADELRASTYSATMPDGTVATKRSLFIHTPTAYLACYKTKAGQWVPNAIVQVPQGRGGLNTFVFAKKVG
jgi:hypothetical protein